MAPEAFRTDRFLRSTGYNFFSWGAVNGLIVLPAFAQVRGEPWSGGLALGYTIGLLVAGVWLAILNDRRVEKMCGPAAASTVVEAGAFWGPLLLLGLFGTILFSVRGPVAWIQPLWMAIVGAGYLTWGGFSVREFRWLGWALILGSGVSAFAVPEADLVVPAPSLPALILWVVSMCALWFPLGAWINWRYVHVRAPRALGTS